jgi:signal peptidase I
MPPVHGTRPVPPNGSQPMRPVHGARPVPPNGSQPMRPVHGARAVPPPREPVNGHRSHGAPPPPPRRPAPDDEPTVVHSDLLEPPAAAEPVPDAASTEIPGRHRRRAGESPEGRPAAAYRQQAEAGNRKARTGRRRRPTFWKELPLLVVVALLLTFLIQTFLAKVYVIPSGSMETTLHGCSGCNNDRVLVDKVTYRFSDPAPGDVVVFRGPDSWSSEVDFPEPDNALLRGLQQMGSLIGLAPPDEKDFVKRVIAVGGQTVKCCDSRNRVLVDGEPLDEPYIYYLPEAGPAFQDRFGPITVPEGQLWMMGDSRNNSADSRAPGHGPVPVDNVIGQARVIVLPFTRFGWIDSIDPQTTAVGLPAPGSGVDGPLALGLLAALPLAVRRRRLDRSGADVDDFLPGHPAPARTP